jgi:membrane protein
MRKTLGQIRAILVEGTAPAADMLSSRARAGLYLARLGIRILKQWARDRCPQQAAALTFQTTLSLVPVLAIALFVLRSTGALDAQSRLVDFLARQVLPDLGDLAGQLQSFSEKISTGAAGGVGLAFTFVACYSLYGAVEKVFNDIWRVHVRRSLVRKLLTFYALVTLLPVLAGLYLYYSGKLVTSGGAARFFGPLGFQLVALFLTNKLLPHMPIKWRAAVIGTLVTALLLEALKWGFVTFAKKILLASYTGIYGPAALVPMLLVWMYASWLLVLLGAEIAHAIQNMKRLEAEDRRATGEEPVNGFVAAQLLAAVAADYEKGGRGLTVEHLAQEFRLSVEVVERLCLRLKQRALIAEVQGDKQGLIPGRAANAIRVEEVLASFRATDLDLADGFTSPVLAALVTNLEQNRHERIADLTVADLLPGKDVAAPTAPLAVRRRQ